MPEMKPKSFFNRPEGTTGMIVLCAGGLVGAILLYNFLPAIIILLQNTIHAAILGGIILGVVALIMNAKFRTTVSYMFKSAMRKFTGWFITIDPIGILKNYIDSMDEKIQKVQDNITNLKGQIGKLKRTIETKQSSKEKELNFASHAKKKNDAMQATLHARNAGRADESIKRMQKIYEKMEMLYRILTNMSKKIKFLREDTANEVENRETEYNAIKSAHAAMSLAKRLIAGGSTEKDLFEQTMQYIADDIGFKMGEMDEFMELSDDFMNNVDLQEGVFDEKGMALLEAWENGDSSLLGEDKGKILNDTRDTNKNWSDDVEVVAQNTQSQFAHMFKN